MLAPGTKRTISRAAETAASATSTRKGRWPRNVLSQRNLRVAAALAARNGGPHLMLVNATIPPPGSFEVAASSREKTMKAVILTIVGLLLSSGLAYAADNPPVQGQPKGHPAVLTDIECNGVWKDAVSGGDMLPGDKAGGYISDFKQADADQDGNISQTEFKKACKKGWIKPEHAESAKMGKDEGSHSGDVGKTPPVESGKIQGQ